MKIQGFALKIHELVNTALEGGNVAISDVISILEIEKHNIIENLNNAIFYKMNGSYGNN